MENFTEYFDSVYDFERVVNSRPDNKVFEGFNGSKREGRVGDMFYGTRDYDEATYFLRVGDWDKMGGLMRIDGNPGFQTISDKVTPRKSYREYGGAVNIPRYLEGEPRCMRRIERVHTQDNIVNIVYQSNMLADEGAEQLIMNGKKVASLVRSLENIGYRVSLYVATCSEWDGQYLTNIIKIKDSGAPFNLLSLTYPICNPSFFRRHTFRWIETVPVKIYTSWRCGYGSTVCDSTKARELVAPYIKKNFKLLTSYDLKKCASVDELIKLFNERG